MTLLVAERSRSVRISFQGPTMSGEVYSKDVVMRGVEMDGVAIDGDISGLVVDGVDVTPLVGSWPPPVSFPVRECLLTVLNEDYHHRLHAERDLDALAMRHSSS